MAITEVDHPEPVLGQTLLMETLGTCDIDFFRGLLGQLINVGTQGRKPDEDGINFILSMVKGVVPQGQTEAMLAAFEVAGEWSQSSGSPAALQATERERQAVELLAKALAARVAGQDTLSAARFEELLRFHPGSLTVLLLSDGRGADEPK